MNFFHFIDYTSSLVVKVRLLHCLAIYHCLRAIRTNGRVRSRIQRNEFVHCGTGIVSNTNSLSGNAAKSGSIHYDYNVFQNVLNAGIDLQDNFDVPIHITQNKFNMAQWTSPFSLSTESQLGIYIHNTSQSFNPLEISYNQIRHCRTGIHLMQQDRGSLWHNDVFFEVPDADLTYQNNVFRRGFRAQNCVGLDFYKNSVIRPTDPPFSLNNDMTDNTSTGSMGTLMCGFSEEDAGNSYRENDVIGLPTHFRLFGNVGSSSFTCNTMQLGIEGFKLEVPGLNPAVLGNQGAPNSPNGNRWVSWPTSGFTTLSRIRSITGVLPANWYWELGQPDEDPEDGGNFQIPNGLFPIATVGPNCTPCPPCAVERLYVILNNIDSIYSTEEDRFLARTYLYQQLKDSLQLLYSGSTYDIELQNFFSAMALHNVGLLNNVEELLSNNDYANAQLFNDQINPSHLAEENLNTVNRVCAEYNLDFELLDSARRSDIEQIAYQHPHIGGLAVYRARAILGIEVDDTHLAFRQKMVNDTTRKQKEMTLIPNPSSGLVDVLLSLDDEEVTHLEVFNLSGIRVFNTSPSSNSGRISLNLNSLPDGIYQIKVRLSTGKKFVDKLVLIRNR